MLADGPEQRTRRLLALEDRMDVAGQPRLASRREFAHKAPELAKPVADDVVVVLAARVSRNPPLRAAGHAVRAPIVVAVGHADHAARIAQHRAHIRRFGNAFGQPRHFAVLPIGDPTLERRAPRTLRRTRHAHQRESELVRLRLDTIAQRGTVGSVRHSPGGLYSGPITLTNPPSR